MSGAGELWLRRYHPAPEARVRLACLPHAGGSASGYHALSAWLAPEVEVLAVQYPGRQDRRREPPVTDIATLAGHVAEALGGEPADRPLALFGHSMGATVAYEVARLLEHRSGTRPHTLFVSGRRAPSRVRPENVHAGDDERVLAELERLSGTDSRLLRDPELRELILPVVRADYTAIERYRRPPGPEPGCPIVVLVGDADPLTTIEEARAWAAHSAIPVDVRVFPGGHFYLEDHLDAVAEVLTGYLTAPAGPPRPRAGPTSRP
ncbi:thioesterase II family protein [Actinomadura litoris]|uniref:Alpha/beta fold hydrolase n=1 Tax=Actinomadura litoris TaxID=2678616 RepID=A0A7K1L5D5_9ACTN|nr:alpha/beta fold hydrolase [Actinomadura litoris]MUN39465.1 alpha/beta fold hydrolase [Actinomadura litoris]